jgi:protein TonB
MSRTRRLPLTDSGARGLRRALLVSAALHALAIVALVVWRTTPPLSRPPAYRVELVGAPSGARQMGVVSPPNPAPAPATAEPAPAPAAAEKITPKEKAIAKKAKVAPPKATPNVAKTRDAAKKTAAKNAKAAPAVAGSGAKGGKGADVANIRFDGIDFPYPGYLTNIVRLIKLNFPEQPPGSTLRAELRFTIHRDGSVTDIDVMKRSGNASFDLNAMGAVEAAGARRGFGALPAGFPDDVLIVYFTFSPESVS